MSQLTFKVFDKMFFCLFFCEAWNFFKHIELTLFDGFKIQATYARLKELEKQGETQTRIAIEDFIAELTAEYYNYIQQQIRLKNFRYAMSLSKERLRIVEERYIVGNFSRLDLQQARVDYNADRAQYMKQQESVKTSLIRLNELMANEDMTESVTVPVSSGEIKICIQVKEKRMTLKEAKIQAPKVSISGDTLNYNVSSYVKVDDRNIGEVLKRIPGVTVTSEGEIYYQNS